MSKSHKRQITVGNKNYSVEVIDGIRYVEGKTIDEFFDTLPIEDVMKFYHFGKQAIEDERDRLQNVDCKYQEMLDNMR